MSADLALYFFFPSFFLIFLLSFFFLPFLNACFIFRGFLLSSSHPLRRRDPCARLGSPFLQCLSWRDFTILALNHLCLVWVYLPTTTGLSVLAVLLLPPDKEDYFVYFSTMEPLPTMVWMLSLYPSWHAPSGFHLPLLLLGSMSSQQDISPKRAWAEPQNKFIFSPHRQTMPSYLWPMTSPRPVLAGYRLVMPGSCMCFTSMFVQSLPATHALAAIWGPVCTFCWSFLASYGVGYLLISRFLRPYSLWG